MRRSLPWLLAAAAAVILGLWWPGTTAAPSPGASPPVPAPTAAADPQAAAAGAAADPLDAGATASREAIAAHPAEPGRGSLLVVVLLEDGTPLPHVAVGITADDGRPPHASARSAVTDHDGRVHFGALAAGPWRIRLDRNVEAEVRIQTGQLTEQRCIVPAGRTVLARVVDGNGQRIPGAVVTLWPAGGLLDAPVATAGSAIGTTSAAGELLLQGLASFGRHGSWLAASHPAFGAAPARMVPGPADDADREPRVVELRLGLRGAWLEVLVLEANREPLADAMVELRPVDHPGSYDDGNGRVLSHLFRSAVTDAGGRAALGPLPPCDYRLEVRRTGCATHRGALRIDGDQPHARTVILVAESCVQASLVGSDGQAVAGVDFRVQSEPVGGRAISSADGRCAIGGLGPGHAVFVASHPAFERAEGRVELEPGTVTDLRVELVPLPTIRGQVVDDAGQPLGGLTVELVAPLPGYETDRRHDVASADGSFAMPARGDLDYQLRVYEPMRPVPLPGTTPATVRPRGEPWLVRVPDGVRASAFVAGALVDAAGRPALWGRFLSVRGDGFEARPGLTMPEGALDPGTGRFRLGPLPPGRYALHFAGEPSFELAGIELRARSTTELGTVVVPATGTLQVELTAAPGLSLDDVLVEAQGPGDSEIFRIDAGLRGSRLLLPGRYRVVVYGTGFRWLAQDVDIEAGAIASVRGELRPAVRFGLRFCMPPGERGAVFTITDAAGAVACTHELEDGVASEDLWPFFECGTFTVAITGSSGRRYWTQFRVPSLERRIEVLELRGEPVR